MSYKYKNRNTAYNPKIEPDSKFKDRKPTLRDFNLINIDITQLEKEYAEYECEMNSKKYTVAKTLMKVVLLFTWCCPLLLLMAIFTFIYDLVKNVNIEIPMGYWIFILLGSIFSMSFLKFDDRLFLKRFNRQSELDLLNDYKKALSEYNWWQNRKAEEYWRAMDGKTFEKEVARVFSNNGYKASLTRNGADGGIDIELEKEGKRIAVQCKAHKSKISESVVRDLYGVLHSYGYDSGMLVTLNGGSRNTVEFCKSKKDKPILIMQLEDILIMQGTND